MPSLISSHKKAWQRTLSCHVLRERGNMQAEYSQSDLSCQQLQQCLTAFQAKPVGHAAVADAQRRGILEAQAISLLAASQCQRESPLNVRADPARSHAVAHKEFCDEEITCLTGAPMSISNIDPG